MSDSGLTITYGENLRALAADMAESLRQGPLGILESPWVVTPSMALRQWLDQQIAELQGPAGGVAANFTSFFPERMVAEVERSCLGDENDHRDWGTEAVVVRILKANPTMSVDDARHQAQLIDELTRWRPDLLTREGAASFSERLRRTLGQLEVLESGPQHQRRVIIERLRDGSVAGVPRHVVIFGLPNVPGGRKFLDIVSALSATTRVDCYIPVPSATLARRVVVEGEKASTIEDELEAPWLRESLESLELWASLDAQTVISSAPRATDPDSTLGRLQRRLIGEVSVPKEPDDSVRVLGAFGSMRQAEQLRDEIFGVIEAGATPDQILVATPEVGTFEIPLERHWSHRHDEDPTAPRLPFEVTLKSAQRVHNRAQASVALLNAIGNYATLEQVSELLAFPAIARGLRLSFEEAQGVLNRAEEGKLIFGTSPEQRRRFGVYPPGGAPGFDEDMGTWERISERIAVSSLYPFPIDTPSVLPRLGEAGDLEAVAKIQPLLRLLDAESWRRQVASDQGDPATESLASWLDLLAGWMRDVAGESDEDPSFERAVGRARSWFEIDTELGTTKLTFDQFSDLWSGLISERTIARPFGAMGVVVSNLRNLEWAPHRVVALLGLDDANLPRAELRSEVMAEPRLADPDPRRAILGSLLAAILSAEERLVVSWNTKDEQTGEVLEPSLPVVDLLSALDEVAPLGNGGWRQGTINSTLRHQFFGDDHPVRRRDPRLARIAAGPTSIVAREVEGDGFELSLAALRTFYRGPAKAYLRHGRNLEIPDDAEGTSTRPAVSISRLDAWAVKEAIVEGVLKTQAWREMATHFRSVPPQEIVLDAIWLVEQPEVRREIDAILENEDLLGDVPPDLWIAGINKPRLFAFLTNLAMEQRVHEQIEADDAIFDPIAIGELGELRFSADDQPFGLERRELPGLGLTQVVSRRWRHDEKAPTLEKDLLSDAITLLALRVLAPEDLASVVTYSYPNHASKPKAEAGVPAGWPSPNRRRVLSIHPDDLSSAEAKHALGELAEIWREGMTDPVPVFRTTTPALLVSGGSPEATWGSPDADGSKSWTRGESMELAHRLLFPHSFRELSEMTAIARYAERLRGCLTSIRSTTFSAPDADPRYTGRSRSLLRATTPEDLGDLIVMGET